jgi:hypothetical protein
MGALEEQARFLVAKYGTTRGPVGSELWSPTTQTVLSVDVIFVIIGLILFGVLFFVIVRDLLAARERERRTRESYERSFDE